MGEKDDLCDIQPCRLHLAALVNRNSSATAAYAGETGEEERGKKKKEKVIRSPATTTVATRGRYSHE